ncbi:MAG: hypothetical protein ACO4CZ_16690 [Planctomycetota bacterium]
MNLIPVIRPAVLLTLTAHLAAQFPANVVPNTYLNLDGPVLSDFAFGAYETRRQLLIDAVALGPSRVRQLAGLQLRRNAGGDQDVLEAGRVHVRVTLSSSPRSAATAEAAFTANRGQDATVVFDGVVDLPACPAPTTDPAPWVEPFAITLPFTVPFRLASGTLCIETETTPYVDPITGTRTDPWWPVDSVSGRDSEEPSVLGPSCWSENPTPAPACTVPDTFVLGGRGIFTLSGPATPRTAVCLVGVSGTDFNGLPLPFALDMFGAPGCSLQVAPFLQIPTTLMRAPAGPRTEGRAELPIPRDGNLAGLPLFAQWMVFSPGTNILGTNWTNGVSIRIDPGLGVPRFAWVEAPDLVSGVGHLYMRRTPVIRFIHN